MSPIVRNRAAELRAIFRRCGYVRRKSEAKYRKLGYNEYKKGSEVRLVHQTATELRAVRTLLREVGLARGKPFVKHARYIQPIYGEAAVEWFLHGRSGTLSPSGFNRDGRRIARRSPLRRRGGA